MAGQWQRRDGGSVARNAVLERGTSIFARYEAVIDEYRARLDRPAPPPTQWAYPPIAVGPTWTVGADGKYILPEWSIGWDAIAFCGIWLQHRRDTPWRFTDEQARFVLWWYALNDSGEFLYRDFVFQRLKGHGKDPLGVCLLFNEMNGPSRFDGWDSSHDPVARDVPDAWVQTVAVSLEQTKNTMRLVPSMVSAAAIEEFSMTIGKEKIYSAGIERLWEAVTSSPSTIEGARASFLLGNETQHWDSSNGGHDMAAVIARNADKSEDGAARTGKITNAYQPGLDSVAEHDREAWEKMEAGTTLGSGLLYDSLEAAPEAPLTAEAAPLVIESIKGDSHWLNTPRIVKSILDPRNPPSQSRRFWYNQITAGEDSWVTPQQFEACPVSEKPLAEGEIIVLFFDGSKSDDATGLVGCRVSDGAVFVLGCWQRPEHIPEWTVPRNDVDNIVRRAFALYDVVGLFCDPGAGEDETGERYWDATIDGWGRDFDETLCVKSIEGGPDRHAVMWDMRSPTRTKLFTEACERTLSDIEERAIIHDGNAILRSHVRNAHRRPNPWGVSIGKESRMSARKIDLAVCMIGARMLRRIYEALPENRKRNTSKPAGGFLI